GRPSASFLLRRERHLLPGEESTGLEATPVPGRDEGLDGILTRHLSRKRHISVQLRLRTFQGENRHR
uniref:Uncharacterized protein n=2 Tax=Ixodes scapularis TaxID=6945 RepID=A0A1S4KTY9_IXOSC